MTKETEKFIKGLRTIKSVACDERVSAQTVYNRIERGVYKVILIDNVKFVLPKK